MAAAGGRLGGWAVRHAASLLLLATIVSLMVLLVHRGTDLLQRKYRTPRPHHVPCVRPRTLCPASVPHVSTPYTASVPHTPRPTKYSVPRV